MHHFLKYEGAGNDFVVFDAMNNAISLSQQEVIRICDRRYGVGADGVIVLGESVNADFEMIYYNADGKIGSMCGNGARCAFSYAKRLGYVSDTGSFVAYDGIHHGRSLSDNWVEVSMQDVIDIDIDSGDFILDTGSPHYVRFVKRIEEVDVVSEGRAIRYSDRFKENGINVNFVEVRDGSLHLSTYERGVEDLTLACGTGAVAVALAFAQREGMLSGPIRLQANGGGLAVNFKRNGNRFAEVVLHGPARETFSGNLEL